MVQHFCPICHKGPIPTLQGLRSHTSQQPSCHKAAHEIAKNRAPNVLTETSDEDQDDEHPTAPTSDHWQDDDNGVLGDEDDTVHAEFDPPRAERSPPSSPVNEPLSKWVQVEEVEDEDQGNAGKQWVEDFPAPVGLPLRTGEETFFERIRREQQANNKEPYAPYTDVDEWRLAHWLASNIGQNQTDTFLKLPIVHLWPGTLPRTN